MPSGSERRISPRVDAKIDVHFRSGDEFVRCYSTNISKGGILLETNELPDPNAMIDVVLELPRAPKPSQNDPEKISLRGRIVRRISLSENGTQIHKVAIQFVEVSPDAQNELDRLYESFVEASA